ncbi:hypothetical protein QQ054_22200 [Oscillatoria amoena NRMC-F 0135]|nr:hypothetical protein [Oscillatoria amoena NRMC-F 0135]
MKKILLFAILCMAVTSFAQSNKEDVDLIQSIYGKEKKAIYAEFIQVEGTQKDAFWKLYDEYEIKRKELGQKRVALLEQYANNYMTLDDATTSKLVKDMAALGVQTDKLISTYHGKIEKAAGAKVAGQFFQLEAYLLSAIRVAIFESIPFIGELK